MPRRLPSRTLSLVAACTVIGASGLALLPASAQAVTPPARATVAAASSIPDPLATGPDAVYKTTYDSGSAEVGGGTTLQEINEELDGDVFIPQGVSGPLPVIVFEHGRHASCTYGGALLDEETLGSPCPDAGPVTEPINSYAGYDYMGQNLASHGYIVMSVDANAVNTYDDASATTVGGDEGAEARAQIISKSLDLLSSWNTTAGPTGIDNRLNGLVDLSRIGVMGHSRGGEGANAFATYNKTRAATVTAAAAAKTLDYGPTYPGVKAIFALAPIDAAAQSPVGYAMGTLVPYCDGDVSDLSGTRPFEREVAKNSAAGFPSVMFGVQGTDHNYYNTTWTGSDDSGSDNSDDNSGDPDSYCGTTSATTLRLSPAEQRNVGLTLIGGFMRYYVGGETAFAPLMTGAAHLPADACPTATTLGTGTTAHLSQPVPCSQEVQTSYVAPAAQRHVIDTPGAATDVPVTTAGFTTAATCTPSNAGVGCPSAASGTDKTFTDRSTTLQRHLVWDSPATLTANLAAVSDESKYSELTLRMAASYTDTRNPALTTQNLTVTLRDAAGHTATVNAADYAAGALVPERTGNAGNNPEMVLGDVQVPLAAFAGVDPASLQTLTLGFGTLTSKGDVDLADIAFQEPASATAVTPAASLPEAPEAVLLVLVGAGVVGTAAMFRRRRVV